MHPQFVGLNISDKRLTYIFYTEFYYSPPSGMHFPYFYIIIHLITKINSVIDHKSHNIKFMCIIYENGGVLINKILQKNQCGSHQMFL